MLTTRSYYLPTPNCEIQAKQAATEEASKRLAELTRLLDRAGVDEQRAAHFLIRLLFCLFAEDVDLLPNRVFGKLIEATRSKPQLFPEQCRQLFSAMSTGGMFALEMIPHFNGGLFDTDDVIALTAEELGILAQVHELDWSRIEPSIMGTLFEHSFDKSKRAQLGAHYTSAEDILRIVKPVLMAPLFRKWDEVKREALKLVERRESTDSSSAKSRYDHRLAGLLREFTDELAGMKVLDPACGSGNFLYVALRELLQLDKDVMAFAGEQGLSRLLPTVNPLQLRGIEINRFAR